MVAEVGGELHFNSDAGGKAMDPSTLAALDGPVEKLRQILMEDEAQELKARDEHPTAAPKGSVNEQTNEHDDILQVWMYCTHALCTVYRAGMDVLYSRTVYRAGMDVLYSRTVYPAGNNVGKVYSYPVYILQVWCTILTPCVSCRYSVL
jgi:hypothetical protein